MYLTRDLRHKTTRQIVNFCVLNGVNKIFVGNPTGIEKRDTGRKHNQRISQWERKDIQYIKEKASKYDIKCFTDSKRGTLSNLSKIPRELKRVKGRN
ncbi:MAG: hypothetical protein ISN64_01695 [Rickettsia sp.]|nr:hypothetical protein [Rickettsia sp.]